MLDEKQWLERIAYIDPKRKPADPEEQKRIIKDIEDCAVGLLNASFSKKFIKKEEINVEAAEMFFDVNSEERQIIMYQKFAMSISSPALLACVC